LNALVVWDAFDGWHIRWSRIDLEL